MGLIRDITPTPMELWLNKSLHLPWKDKWRKIPYTAKGNREMWKSQPWHWWGQGKICPPNIWATRLVASLFPKFTLLVWSKQTLQQNLKATPTPLVVLPGSHALAEQMHIFCGGLMPAQAPGSLKTSPIFRTAHISVVLKSENKYASCNQQNMVHNMSGRNECSEKKWRAGEGRAKSDGPGRGEPFWTQPFWGVSWKSWLSRNLKEEARR